MVKNEIPPSIKALLRRLHKLPTPTPIYFDMIDYLKTPAASFVGAARIIESDVAMTAELLKMTNSLHLTAAFGINSPLQAIRALGFDILCSIVLQLGLFQNASSSLFEQNLIGVINQDSCNVANVARRIAKLEKFNSIWTEQCVCAGMLNSIGALVLLECLPDGFNKVIHRVSDGQDPLEAEMAEFGVDHFTLGGYFLQQWGFKTEVVKAVAHAGQPSALPPPAMNVTTVVHIARVLAGPFPGFFAGTTTRDELGRIPLDMAQIRYLGKEDRLATWMAESGGLV